MNLEVEKKVNNEEIRYVVKGRIASDNADLFSDAVVNEAFGDKKIIFDFTDLTYITSAGIRVLIISCKKSSKKITILNANDVILDILKMVNLCDYINFEYDNNALHENKTVDKDIDINNNDSFSFVKKLVMETKKDKCSVKYIYKGAEYTAVDIDRISQIIADDLVKKGVKKDTHVGICGLNSINWICTFFALQKIGAVACLLNFASTPKELNNLIETADITHVCYAAIEGKTYYLLYNFLCKAKFYNISDKIDYRKRYSEYEDVKDKYREIYDSDKPSLIIFSSGSTGKPKAIIMSENNLSKNIKELDKVFEKDRIKNICAVLPFFHIFSFCTNVVFTIDKDILTIIPSISQYGIKNLMELIYEYKCTAIPLVPTVLKKMLNEPISDLVKISTLRYILAGGEPIDEASIKKLHDNLPDCVYASVYGMSENACISISRKNDTVEQITKTVGKPLSCITIEIRDNVTGKVLNVGEEGVIHFKSSVMTPCYYKLPIERQPFDDRGFLDTGDIGSIDHDGYLRIVGRVKDLIIRGGENISPGEIRDEIMKYSDIALAEVVGVPNDTYGEEVDAAIVLKSGSTFNEDKLRTALLKKLSKYKVPEHFIVYDSLPKLTNGKVDKVKLKNDMKKHIYNI